jgi:hypothetical protein
MVPLEPNIFLFRKEMVGIVLLLWLLWVQESAKEFRHYSK